MGLNDGVAGGRFADVDVTVVGSGPNGLAAAVICARAGLSVRVIEAQPTLGGGARTLPDPEFSGVVHDICSAVHPLALASPFLAEFDLPARGVRLSVPEVSYGNPLPGRAAAIGYHDLERTCAELEVGASWQRLFGPLVEHSDGALGFFLGDKRSLPPDLVTTVRAGLRVLAQGSPAWGLLRGDDARALFTGVAAHTISTMPSLVSAGAGLMLATLAHTVGWPIPVGGSQAIPDALMDDLRAHGGTITAGQEVTEPPGGVVLYDTAPTALLSIYRDAVPARYAKALRRYRFGPGVAKVDFVLSDEIPWKDQRLARATTLHMGGSRSQMAHAERQAAAGTHPEWPMILAALPHLADPNRVDAQGRRPLWTYAHVPSGSSIDQTETVTAIFERFAPGFRDIVVAARSIPAAQLADHNANYIGGDIGVGGNTLYHALAGPTPRVNPWATPIPKVYLCSSATPPGGGVHGMAGYYAARTVLRKEFGIEATAKAVAVTADSEELPWERFGSAAAELAERVAADGFTPDLILAVARGGLFVAGALAYELGVKNVAVINVEFYTGVDERLDMPVVLPPVPNTVDLAGARVLIADDVADTGETLRLVRDFCADHVADARCAVLYQKPQSSVDCEYVWRSTDLWINFPWSGRD